MPGVEGQWREKADRSTQLLVVVTPHQACATGFPNGARSLHYTKYSTTQRHNQGVLWYWFLCSQTPIGAQRGSRKERTPGHSYPVVKSASYSSISGDAAGLITDFAFRFLLQQL
jgi:hypothetical protein